jgi:hypothetical protein
VPSKRRKSKRSKYSYSSEDDSYSSDEEARRKVKKKTAAKKAIPKKTIKKKVKRYRSAYNEARAKAKESRKAKQESGEYRKKIGTTKISGTAGWTHNLDPYTRFPDEDEMRADLKVLEATLAVPGPKARAVPEPIVPFRKRKVRVATLYSILQDTRVNQQEKKFPVTEQGPHTIPHYYILDSLVNARKQSRLAEIAGLRMPPETFEERVYQEIPVRHPRRERAEIAVRYYRRIYEKGTQLLQKEGLTRAEETKLTAQLNKALNLNPYQTYKYHGHGASSRDLQYKGERRDKPVGVDLPDDAGYHDFDVAVPEIKRLLRGYGKFHE